MAVNAYVFHIVLLLLPGVIAAKLYRSLRGTPERETWEALVEILLLSLVSYLLYALGYEFLYAVHHCWTLPEENPDTTLKALQGDSGAIPWGEVLWGSAIAVALGPLLALLDANLSAENVRFWRPFTKNRRDEDVWQKLQRGDTSSWFRVRDIKLDLYYEGWIQFYSSPNRDRELFLREVHVFRNSDGKALYEVPGLYLSREKDDLVIEIIASKP